MTFRTWAKQQIQQHDAKARRYKDGEIRAHHQGASDALHRALAMYERDQNQVHRERMKLLERPDIRPA